MKAGVCMCLVFSIRASNWNLEGEFTYVPDPNEDRSMTIHYVSAAVSLSFDVFPTMARCLQRMSCIRKPWPGVARLQRTCG